MRERIHPAHEEPSEESEKERKEREERERAMDKTLEDSFPASDPPSTVPDPGETSEDDE